VKIDVESNILSVERVSLSISSTGDIRLYNFAELLKVPILISSRDTMDSFTIENITIPTFSLKHKAAQSTGQFAVFELTVEAISNGTRLRWTVHRRYTDFEELHNKLVRSGYPGLTDLPGKRLMGNLSTAFLDQRREELQSYILATVQCTEATRSASFMGFIGAVQFLDQANTEMPGNGDGMTAFPYAFRSGRYNNSRQSKPADEPSCRVLPCTVS